VNLADGDTVGTGVGVTDIDLVGDLLGSRCKCASVQKVPDGSTEKGPKPPSVTKYPHCESDIAEMTNLSEELIERKTL
jgi:hypothetical protein